jgi:hypothetical protein
MKLGISSIVVLLGALLGACGGSSSSTRASDEYAGKFVFQMGAVNVNCGGGQSFMYDLAHEAQGQPGYFTDTVTGDTTFHHVDVNGCQFDFTVSDGSATTSGGSCQVPNGMGGTTTYDVHTLTFQPTADGKGLVVNGDGSIGGCPMTIGGTTTRQ